MKRNGDRVPIRALAASGILLGSIALEFGPSDAEAQERIFADAPAWTGPAERTFSVALGDVDGDGDLDLVRGNDGQSATLYPNIGESFSSVPSWRGPAEATSSVALGDIDGDGDLDLVRGNFFEGATLYLNTGGTFTANPSWTGPVEGTTSVALGDVDGDGDLDLVRGNEGQGATLYLNTGGTFARAPAWTGPEESTRSVALGDVDGDGHLDLIRGSEGQGATLYRGTGLTFEPAPAWVGPPENTWCVVLGDVDGDGRLDLVRGNLNGGATLYLNTGGTFAASPAWTGPAESTSGIALGDVDGDGDLDLVCGNSGQGATLYPNTGGTFAPAPSWTGPVESTRCVALADIDGDGDLDLIRGSANSGATLYRNVSGTFAPAPSWRGPAERSFSVTLGDVDGDGDLDLVRGNFSGGVTLHRNVGGTFALTPDWVGPADYTRDVALGDIDGDGDLDLVCGNLSRGATCYLNTGGTFNPIPSWTGPEENTQSVALGDVDGDGDLDLVCGNTGSGSTLYLNSGSKFASSPTWKGPEESTQSVALGDVDGDGNLDLVCGNLFRAATLHLNTGGTFTPTPDWTGPAENTRSIVLGDIDGDGDLDLVRGNSGQGVTLYRNTGGTFAHAPAWTGPTEDTRCVTLGDGDGDGDLDLVSGNSANGATLYLNTGDTFTPIPDWTGPAENTCSIALGDIDGDGDLDLVSGNDGQPASLYLNRSPWLLATTGTPTGLLPNSPAHLRWVHVGADGTNRYRVSFQAFDAESDSLWLVGEYEFAGTSAWHPMDFEGSASPVGPFTASPLGAGHDLTWDVSRLPIDRREVVVRLRAISPPRRAGAILFIPTYLVAAGSVMPVRAALVATPPVLEFAVVTLGDSMTATLDVANPGNRDLVIDQMISPDPELLVPGELPIVLPPGQHRSFEIILAPRRPISALGLLQIHSNDPASPVTEIPLIGDVRRLEISTQLLTPAPLLPLGDAATLLVTPAPEVHVERGSVYYWSRTGLRALPDSAPLGRQGSVFVAVVPGQGVTETGLEYYVRVENSGVFATDPAGAPDSSFFHAVAAPAGISTAARPDPGGDFPVGRPTSVVVSLPVGATFEDGTLFFRSGGAALYDSVQLGLVEVAPGLFSPSAVIPAGAVGARGLEFWARVRTLTRTLTDPRVDYREHPLVLRTNVENLLEHRSHAGEHHRMISLPLELGLAASASLEALLSDQPEFGTYDPTRWRAFRYLPDLGSYLEISSAPLAGGKLRPEPGRAFWLISRSAHQVDTAPVAGRSTSTDKPYRVTLETGWNQIGDPFLFPVSWRDVVFEEPFGDLAPEPPVAWDESAERYRDEDVEVLQPFEGYWVRNSNPEPVVILITPDQATVASTPTPSSSEERKIGPATWRLQVVVTAGPASDTRNFIGVAASARDGQDSLDRSDPPLVPGPAVSLYFLDDSAGPSAEGKPLRLTTDMRSPILDSGDPAKRGHRWIFDVAATGGEGSSPEARLDFQGIERVPSDLQLLLVDRSLEEMIDLRQQPGHVYACLERNFVASETEARFEILAGTPAFVAAGRNRRADRPWQTRLLPSFPNPMGYSTIVRFETARAGRVTVAVFDVAGRRIRTLADVERDPGLHEVGWRGDDERGEEVAPGVYLVRLAAPDRSETRKLVKSR